MSNAPEKFGQLESEVQASQVGKNIAAGLACRFAYRGESSWRDLIEKGCILLNGAILPADTLLKKGDRLTYLLHDYREPEVNGNYGLLFRRDGLLLVDKPSGIPVHRTGKIFFNTLTGILRRHLNFPKLTPLHRLDVETGGLMLFGEDRDFASTWQKQLEFFLLRKCYLVVVEGEFSEELDMNLPLGLREGDPIRSRMHVVGKGEGKSCHTHFLRVSVSRGWSLLLAELFSGRKHQIRAHLAHLGFPVLGDKMYSREGHYYLKRLEADLREEDLQNLGSSHQLLQSWAVLLANPAGMSFKNPEWFFSTNFSAEWLRALDEFPGWQEKAQTLLKKSS